MTTRDGLTDIARRHGTDKADGHSYTDFYEDLLAPLRDKPIRLLEIGIGGYEDPMAGGASLRMWKEYLPCATIVGLDYVDKSGLAEDRIIIVQGDQSDSGSLLDVVERHGPFDVIIDDGSHVNRHVINTFETLFPTLADGGLYVVEDLQTAYWPEFGGRFRPGARHTSMGFLRHRVTRLNYSEYRIPGYRVTSLDETILEIRFRHNIAAVVKGDNREESIANRPHPIPVGDWAGADLRAAMRVVRSSVAARVKALVRR